MSRTCDLCGKHPAAGNNRSFSMRATKRRFLANLQTKKMKMQGQSMTLKLCSTCIRTMSRDQITEKKVQEFLKANK
jgi:large subunit ribosomal protein L28